MQFLVIDVDLAHFRLDTLSGLLSKTLLRFFSFHRITLLPNARLRNPG